MMQEQDKRAIEGMARCGISLEGLLDAFPSFSKDEVTEIYNDIHRSEIKISNTVIKMNCS